MASAEFDASIDEKRPTVQVGDPFTEKRLMEACLELMATGAVISIQDMGAAGLTCSAVEMGDKGDLGIRLDLDRVPVREARMTAYEMMLSESQERMLMVLRPEKEAVARAVFDKWDLDFAVVGETIPEDRFIVRLGGEVKADLPLKALSGAAPEYDRPWVATPPPASLGPVPEIDPIDALMTLIASPNFCSRSWVWTQYDHMVMADTVLPPGSDAGVVRIHGTDKAIAFTSDVNPRYCRANPERGGMQAVAEAYRNLSATGARPLAATDNLNFGNPERPEIMGQLVGCIQGIGKACAALDMPIVSGNVSLYNETEGRAILPTPTIGAIGLLASLDDLIRMAPHEGDVLLLLGTTRGHLGQSALLAELYGREEGDAPPVDLAAERAAGIFLRAGPCRRSGQRRTRPLRRRPRDRRGGNGHRGPRRRRGVRRCRTRCHRLVLRGGSGPLPAGLPGREGRRLAGTGGRGGGSPAGRGRGARHRCPPRRRLDRPRRGRQGARRGADKSARLTLARVGARP